MWGFWEGGRQGGRGKIKGKERRYVEKGDWGADMLCVLQELKNAVSYPDEEDESDRG